MAASNDLYNATKVGDIWYRYRDQRYAAPLDEYDQPSGPGTLEVQLDYYRVVKRTPAGVRLRWTPRPDADTSAFSLSEPDRLVCFRWTKMFAEPTKELALVSFIARKKRQLDIYNARASSASLAKSVGERMLRVVRGEPTAMDRVLRDPSKLPVWGSAR